MTIFLRGRMEHIHDGIRQWHDNNGCIHSVEAGKDFPPDAEVFLCESSLTIRHFSAGAEYSFELTDDGKLKWGDDWPEPDERTKSMARYYLTVSFPRNFVCQESR